MNAMPIPLRVDRTQYFAELGDRVMQRLQTSVRWLSAEQLADTLDAPGEEVWRILQRLHARRQAHVRERRMVRVNGEWQQRLVPVSRRLADYRPGMLVWSADAAPAATGWAA